MSYNPFITGNFPVGVRTAALEGRNNTYEVEIWYPAADEYRGLEAVDRFKFVDEYPEATQEATRNATPSEGKRPLVVYWHGGYGHRRELSAMCVFLASHGFTVAAPDFPGDHVSHTFGADPLIAKKPIDDSAKARPAQGAEIIELLDSSDDEFITAVVDAAKVGSFGMSMGGYTALAVNSRSPRMKASVPICPMTGSRSMVSGIRRLSGLLRTDDWKSEVSTFVLTGDEDSFVIVDDVRELFERIAEPKRLAILKGAGHIHWTDNAELIHETMRTRYASGQFPDPELDAGKMAVAMKPFAELCPADHAAQVMRSIVLAQFDANLKSSFEAKAFLENDLIETFAARGIDVEVSPQARAVAN